MAEPPFFERKPSAGLHGIKFRPPTGSGVKGPGFYFASLGPETVVAQWLWYFETCWNKPYLDRIGAYRDLAWTCRDLPRSLVTKSPRSADLATTTGVVTGLDLTHDA